MIVLHLKGEAWIRSRRKRLLDLTILACIFPFTVVITACTLVLSVLEHGARYVIFTQNRVGKNGIHFRIHKIRTMHTHTTTELSPVGEFLSVLGADETPQLLYTIWSGKMALIGPRPLIPQDFALMRSVLGKQKFQQWRRSYIACRPGWMSVFSSTSRLYKAQSPAYLRARHHFDTYYYEHACFTLDVATFLKSLTMWCTPPQRILQAAVRLLQPPKHVSSQKP